MRMRAILAVLPVQIKQDAEEALYRDYVARGIRMITESAAKMNGGSYITEEYADMLHPKREEKRTAEEIIADVAARAGIEVI